MILIILLVLESVSYERYDSNYYNITIMREGIPGGFQTLINYTSWLNENTPEGSIIMDSATTDIPLYLNRTIFWDYRLFYLKKTDLVYYLYNYYNISYVVIRETQIIQDPNNFVSVPLDSDFLNLLQDTNYSKKVYDYNRILIFNITRDTNLNSLLNTNNQNINQTGAMR